MSTDARLQRMRFVQMVWRVCRRRDQVKRGKVYKATGKAGCPLARADGSGATIVGMM